eukprot:CAMPEP_0118992556 /NCGR_PEP_ID=MMETSP1173-20130426/53612_1 /TAXON_ID=1034831 /ORGANISM="Rhizochromulina marina cf, Strain CCMP1243" /LENGTH=70 /DNA_ID=CAMNT_0006943749 /DNA_START=18 /DNA_END=226 /DNA_ORIENTATION=-
MADAVGSLRAPGADHSAAVSMLLCTTPVLLIYLLLVLRCACLQGDLEQLDSSRPLRLTFPLPISPLDNLA